jgi:anti-sigma-K factor RskA
VWSEPPASLGDSIVAAIAAERVTSPAPPATADLDVQRRRRRPGRWLGAVAAAALALAIGAGLLLTREGDEQPGDQLAITGTDLAPDASATAVVDDTGAGVAIRLDLRGLEPAPEGQYYQGWLRNAEGELVSIGTFHMRDGDATITLWAGVEVKDYPTLTVTLQTEDEGTGSSGQVVLRGSLTDA